MSTKNITLRTRPSKIVHEFTVANRTGKIVNLKTEDGYLSLVGGRVEYFGKQLRIKFMYMTEINNYGWDHCRRKRDKP